MDNQKVEYTEHYMYRVTTLTTGGEDGKTHFAHISLFEDKRQAELFVKAMIADGNSASMNKWTWKTLIEK